MERPSIEHVYQAVDALYHTQQVDGKEAASKWLNNFQQSLFAWELCDQLLRQNRDPESTYFAAQTMKTKIQSHFAELPMEQHLALRNSLIEHLLQYSLASHATLTQLCLALADLAIQCPQWTTPVNDLVQKFSTKLEHFSILLEILMIMPEELENEILRIGVNRRNEVIASFTSAATVVFDLMMKCHEICPTDDRTQCKLYKCFGNWLTLGSFPPKDVAESRMLKLAFETLLSKNISENLHEAISDCLSNAIYAAGDINNQLPLAEALFTFVSATLPQAYETSVKEKDLDRSINYARIFAEMGESFLEPILTTPGHGPGNLQTLDLILSSTAHPNYEVAEISFNFWYRFAECLDETCGYETRQLFKPYVQKLIAHLCHLCEFEDTYEGVPQKGDEFQEFRLRVLDVIHDVVYIVGTSECFKHIFQSIQQNQKWNNVEACLFTMNPLTRFLPKDDESPGFVLQMILNLPPSVHILVRHTSVVLIGDLSSWIAEHDQLIDPAFQFILTSLQHKDLAQMGAYALSKFCHQACHKMNKMFPILLQVSKAVESLKIDNDGVTAMLTGCALVLSNMPLEHVSDGLMHLCTPHVQPLYEVMKQPSGGDPVKYLDRLAAIFRSIQVNVAAPQQHPCTKVIEQLWDLFKSVAAKYKSDDRIMERHFRCIRFGIRCIGQDFMHLIDQLVELMMTIYKDHPHSCFLYIGSVLVDQYGKNQAAEKSLMTMLKAFVPSTFQLLSKENGLVQHPDTVDDFFRLCIRFLQQNTLLFLQVDSIDSIIQLAIAGTNLDHRDANLSVMKFLIELTKCTYIEQGDPKINEARQRVTLVESLLGKYGQDIIKGLVSACCGGIQGYMLPEAADVMWEMIQFCQRPTTLWLKDALSVIPSHNAVGTINATPQQIESFYTNITTATAVKVLWKEFREFSKYFK